MVQVVIPRLRDARGRSPPRLGGLCPSPEIPLLPGMRNDRGQIAPGKRADLLLVDGDPTTRIADVSNVVAVWSWEFSSIVRTTGPSWIGKKKRSVM